MVSSLLLPDVEIPAKNENIIGIIAVQNNAITYIAERTSFDPNYKFPDFYYEKDEDLIELNRKVREGEIMMSERTRLREELLINKVLERFYEKGERILDGRQ